MYSSPAAIRRRGFKSKLTGFNHSLLPLQIQSFLPLTFFPFLSPHSLFQLVSLLTLKTFNFFTAIPSCPLSASFPFFLPSFLSSFLPQWIQRKSSSTRTSKSSYRIRSLTVDCTATSILCTTPAPFVGTRPRFRPPIAVQPACHKRQSHDVIQTTAWTPRKTTRRSPASVQSLINSTLTILKNGGMQPIDAIRSLSVRYLLIRTFLLAEILHPVPNKMMIMLNHVTVQ